MYTVTATVQIFLFLCLEMSYAFLPLQSGSSNWKKEHDGGCLFGDRVHELGSSWHPNLGEPFGTMYCIRCDCSLKEDENGRRTSKVSCQDIRKFCPATDCKETKIQRGECCPSCPEAVKDTKWSGFPGNSRFASTLNDDSDSANTDDLKKYHAILLNGPDEQMRFVARSTFTLHRENLHFTIQYFGQGIIHEVEVVEGNDNVLLTQEPSPRKISRSHICGVWRNLPRSILNALESDNLSMKVFFKTSLLKSWDKSNNNSILDTEYLDTFALGQIRSHRALAEETFSSILRRKSEEDVKCKGGAAVIITLAKNFKQIDFVVLHRNVAPENNRKRKANHPLYMKLELRNNKNETLRKTDVRIPDKIGEVADSWNANAALLRLLGEGSLHITLEAREGRRGQVGRYFGKITTKATCDLLQAVVSGNICNPPKAAGSVGSAMIQINADNTVSYQMTFSKMKSKVRSLQFRAFYRKRTRVIADVTAQFRNGEASGVMKEISARELHLLQNGESWITVSTDLYPHCEIQGNIVSLLYNRDSARYKASPIPLAGSYVSPPVSTGAGGHAWLHLDHNCTLHYEIVVSGLSKDVDSTVNAHLHGLAEISGMELTHKKLLKGFYGTEARGILREIPNELYQLMNDGTAFVQVRHEVSFILPQFTNIYHAQVATKRNPSGEIRGKVHIPNSCMQSGIQKIASKDLDERPNKKMNHGSCHFEGKWYGHDTQWAPDYDKMCTTCACWRGRATCQPVSCPSTDCFYPVVMESECCPACQDSPPPFVGKSNEGPYSIAPLLPSDGIQRNVNTDRRSRYNPRGFRHQVRDGCYQNGDQILHPRGTSWNPIVAPFGRIACVSCTCHDNNEYSCERIICPPTTCSNPKRKKPGDCCKTCEASDNLRLPANVETGRSLPRIGWMRDETSRVRMCSFGKDLHPVGSSWKPKAYGLGEVRCIICTCQMDSELDVVAKCRRHCPIDNK